MAKKLYRRDTGQEDRVGRKMHRTSKKGLKKAKIWKDSKYWSNNDLNEN